MGGFGGLFGCRQWVAVTPEEKRCRAESLDTNDWCVTLRTHVRLGGGGGAHKHGGAENKPAELRWHLRGFGVQMPPVIV